MLLSQRDTLLAHGASSFLLDRLKKCSDGCTVNVCATCGFIADTAEHCGFCNSGKEIKKTGITHSLLLLKRELEGMHIGMRIKL